MLLIIIAHSSRPIRMKCPTHRNWNLNALHVNWITANRSAVYLTSLRLMDGPPLPLLCITFVADYWIFPVHWLSPLHSVSEVLCANCINIQLSNLFNDPLAGSDGGSCRNNDGALEPIESRIWECLRCERQMWPNIQLYDRFTQRRREDITLCPCISSQLVSSTAPDQVGVELLLLTYNRQ